MPAAAVDSRKENLAKIACAYAGFAWGVFWIPLRFMNDAGIEGAWASVPFYLLPLPPVLLVLVWRWRRFIAGGWRLHLIGIVAGTSLVLYSNSVIYTEVIRAMLLYYMTPVWSTFLARIWLKEAITPVRTVAIVLGLSGMLVIFGIDLGIPWPRNAGDWLGLAAGIVWAVAAVLMRENPSHEAPELLVSFTFWAAVAAVVMALVPYSAGVTPPKMTVVLEVLPWLVPVLLVIVVPASYAVMWGTPLLNPGVVGLLFMTEISVGTVTAAIWAGEPFGLRQITGVVLISLAGLAEVIAVPLGRLRLRGTGRQ